MNKHTTKILLGVFLVAGAGLFLFDLPGSTNGGKGSGAISGPNAASLKLANLQNARASQVLKLQNATIAVDSAEQDVHRSELAVHDVELEAVKLQKDVDYAKATAEADHRVYEHMRDYEANVGSYAAAQGVQVPDSATPASNRYIDSMRNAEKVLHDAQLQMPLLQSRYKSELEALDMAQNRLGQARNDQSVAQNEVTKIDNDIKLLTASLRIP